MKYVYRVVAKSVLARNCRLQRWLFRILRCHRLRGWGLDIVRLSFGNTDLASILQTSNHARLNKLLLLLLLRGLSLEISPGFRLLHTVSSLGWRFWAAFFFILHHLRAYSRSRARADTPTSLAEAFAGLSRYAEALVATHTCCSFLIQDWLHKLAGPLLAFNCCVNVLVYDWGRRSDFLYLPVRPSLPRKRFNVLCWTLIFLFLLHFPVFGRVFEVIRRTERLCWTRARLAYIHRVSLLSKCGHWSRFRIFKPRSGLLNILVRVIS